MLVSFWKSLLWSCVIMFICFLPGSSVPEFTLHLPFFDKLVHFGIFFILSVLLIFDFHQWSIKSGKTFRNLFWILLFSGSLFALLTELIQSLPILSRDMEAGDLLADITGLAAGHPAGKFLLRKLFPQS